MDDIKNVYVLVYKRAEISAPWMSYSVERMKKDDIGSAVELINGYYRGWIHFEPFTAESFESHLSRIPGYGLDNVWVAEDGGEIIACAGLWDCSTLADFCYAREPLSWKAMGLVLRSLSRFTRVPRIAREGEYFKFHFLTDCAFDQGNPDCMKSLLSHINNVLLEEGRSSLVAMVDPEEPVFPLLKKRQLQIETWHLFDKSFDRPLPDFSPLYADIRDMIP